MSVCLLNIYKDTGILIFKISAIINIYINIRNYCCAEIANANLHKFVFSYKQTEMTRETLIRNTMNSLSKLPKERLSEVSDFVDFILAKDEEENLRKGIVKLSEESKSLNFLSDEEELYSVSDLKKRFK